MIRVDLLEIIDLKGPSGCLWHVGLAKSGSTVYLQYGWKEFVEAHHLEVHYVLFFGYEGVIPVDVSGSVRILLGMNENQEETEECSLKILEPSTTAAHEVVGCNSASSPNSSNFPKESSPTNNTQSGEDNFSGRKLQKGEPFNPRFFFN